MWPTYQEGLSIDRIDWNWNYCKENCRWADKFTQNNNRSNNILSSDDWPYHNGAGQMAYTKDTGLY